MTGSNRARLLFYSLAALLLLQAGISYPQLPDVLASHFGASGSPNGFQSKTVFFGMLLTILLGVGSLMTFVVPALLSSRPGITNLPNQQYWFAPERRAATLRFLTVQFTSSAAPSSPSAT